MRVSRYFPAVSAAVLLSAALAGCNNPPAGTTAQNGNATMAALAMPLTTGPETPAAPAPPVTALPRAAPVRVAHVTRPEDNYAYVERAYAMSNAFGDAPPDYDYDYGPTHLWAWRGYDNSTRLVEPIDGGDRYYYYQPGRDVPYLIRDYDNSYGYDDRGDLVVVYDREGRPVPYTDRYTDPAARELARARSLYAASLNSERREVRAADWAARRSRIDAARSEWAAEQSREAEWRAYHDAHEAEQAAYWQTEQARRERENQAFDDWQHRDYQGPVPVAFVDRRNAYQTDPGPQHQQPMLVRTDLKARQEQQQVAQQERLAAQARVNQQRADQEAQQHQLQIAQQQRALAEQRQHQQQGAELKARQEQQQVAQQEKIAAQARVNQHKADLEAQQHQLRIAQQQRAQAEQRQHQQQGVELKAHQEQQQVAQQEKIAAQARINQHKADLEAQQHQLQIAQQQQQQARDAQRAHEQAEFKAHQQQADVARQQAMARQAQERQAVAQHKAHPAPPQNAQAHGHAPEKPGRHDRPDQRQ